MFRSFWGVKSNTQKISFKYYDFGCCYNEGHPQGLRVNAAAYIEVLKTVVNPWINSVCNGRPYIFQQDLAPSRKAQTMQEWMVDNLYDHIISNIWTPSSPDLNTQDYYMWSIVEKEVLFTNPSARAGYDTRSIFKRSLTGLNSEFSFS